MGAEEWLLIFINIPPPNSQKVKFLSPLLTRLLSLNVLIWKLWMYKLDV